MEIEQQNPRERSQQKEAKNTHKNVVKKGPQIQIPFVQDDYGVLIVLQAFLSISCPLCILFDWNKVLEFALILLFTVCVHTSSFNPTLFVERGHSL